MTYKEQLEQAKKDREFKTLMENDDLYERDLKYLYALFRIAKKYRQNTSARREVELFDHLMDAIDEAQAAIDGPAEDRSWGRMR